MSRHACSSNRKDCAGSHGSQGTLCHFGALDRNFTHLNPTKKESWRAGRRSIRHGRVGKGVQFTEGFAESIGVHMRATSWETRTVLVGRNSWLAMKKTCRIGSRIKVASFRSLDRSLSLRTREPQFSHIRQGARACRKQRRIHQWSSVSYSRLFLKARLLCGAINPCKQR